MFSPKYPGMMIDMGDGTFASPATAYMRASHIPRMHPDMMESAASSLSPGMVGYAPPPAVAKKAVEPLSTIGQNLSPKVPRSALSKALRRLLGR